MAYDRREHGIKDPENFITKYNGLEDFRNRWCKNVILIELIHTRLTFEEANLFSYCTIIQEEIDKYTDKLLEAMFDITNR